MPNIARLVIACIQQDQNNYSLHAWVVMPNHVHLLITPRANVSEMLRRIKGVTSREANKQLNRTGKPFWQHESYDRLVRNSDEFRRIENYIIQNPVKANWRSLA
jgi:REP element-mobilizing transposase RayT